MPAQHGLALAADLTPSSFLFGKGTISGRPGTTYKAWAQEAADASAEAMKTSWAAELAAGQARRYKYFAKSARAAAQQALQEMESHLAKDRVKQLQQLHSALAPLHAPMPWKRRRDSKFL